MWLRYAALLCFVQFCTAARPEQVHLSYMGDATSMAVTWITFDKDATLIVNYGLSKDALSQQVTPSIEEWTYGTITRYSYRALMTGLTPATQYFYQIGDRSFSFNSLADNPQSYKACVFGDLGYYHGNSTQSIINRGLSGGFDIIIHLGDMGYDLHTNDGKNGDDYMNQLEPLISKIPYMVIAGNHEDDGMNFTNYQKRFWMPENGYGDNQFYSFDLGPIHFVGVSTENYGFYYAYGMDPVLTQYDWLQRDLKSARDRQDVTPWIATFQHRPFYCSNENSADCQSFENKIIRTGWLDMPGLEPLFLDYNVDLGFWGHEHSYERFYPVADKTYYDDANAYINPKAPVYFISGSAGCHTPDAEFTNPWPWSASRSNDYGYTIMTVANKTHIHFEQISLDKNEADVDDFWVVKDNAMANTRQMRLSQPGKKFPPMKCHPKNLICRMSLKQINEEL